MEGSLPGEVPNFTLHNTSPAMMPGKVWSLQSRAEVPSYVVDYNMWNLHWISNEYIVKDRDIQILLTHAQTELENRACVRRWYARRAWKMELCFQTLGIQATSIFLHYKVIPGSLQH